MSESHHDNSRRNFIKISSLAGVGSLLINDPFIKLFAAQLGMTVNEFARTCFTCELLRQSDLLHLKYFFYNAKILGNHIQAENARLPLFVYVQIPIQHIGEELQDVRDEILKRSDFQKKKSFSGDHSKLGFKLKEGQKQLLLTSESLLNWSANFQLVTLDDYALKSKNTFTLYQGVLKRIKAEFSTPPDKNMLTWHQNFANNGDILGPLTKFELPYKMFLSPIAEPTTDLNNPDLVRQYKDQPHRTKDFNVI